MSLAIALSLGGLAALSPPTLAAPLTLSASAPAATAAHNCPKPTALPPLRRAGSLTVESPPRPKPERWLRLRTHSYAQGMSGRYWEGVEVPLFVPLRVRSAELALLDPVAGGYLALYRDHAGSKSMWHNRDTEARLYDCAGQQLASVRLDRLLSRPTHLEVQDVRYDRGVLYFNEACMTYSKLAGGACSSLVAADPNSGKVLWRSKHLSSNNVIALTDQYVITGYGFTGERASLKVLRRQDGKQMTQQPLPMNHFELETVGDRLLVEVGGSWLGYRMAGFSGAQPRLVPLGKVANPHPAVAKPAQSGARRPGAMPLRPPRPRAKRAKRPLEQQF